MSTQVGVGEDGLLQLVPVFPLLGIGKHTIQELRRRLVFRRRGSSVIRKLVLEEKDQQFFVELRIIKISSEDGLAKRERHRHTSLGVVILGDELLEHLPDTLQAIIL